MKVVTTKEVQTKEGIKPVGTEIEHPNAHLLVQLGVAEPVDEEAKERANQYKLLREKRMELVNRQRQQKAAALQAQAQKQHQDRLAAFEQRLQEPAAAKVTPKKKD